MLEAMREGSKDAACFLYWILSEEGRTERMSDVMDAIDRSVDEGHPRSMLCMADALSKGVLVEPCEEKAIGYAREAYRSSPSFSGTPERTSYSTSSWPYRRSRPRAETSRKSYGMPGS